MNIKHNPQSPSISKQENNASHWTSGPVISSRKSKGFDHSGGESRVIDMMQYVLEVFPPSEVAKHMGQPAPDAIHHLEKEELDRIKNNRRIVSFKAHISLSLKTESSVVEIILESEQRQNGGIYKQESNVPQSMICIGKSPIDTVVNSLNNALHQHRWYPPY